LQHVLSAQRHHVAWTNELDGGTKLDAIEYAEVASAELIGDTNLGSGCGRRMECGIDGRRESRRAALAGAAPVESIPQAASGGGTGGGIEQSGPTTRARYANKWMKISNRSSRWTPGTYHY
jgi:hypothetical protein